jgi:hypothetical protein
MVDRDVVLFEDAATYVGDAVERGWARRGGRLPRMQHIASERQRSGKANTSKRSGIADPVLRDGASRVESLPLQRRECQGCTRTASSSR